MLHIALAVFSMRPCPLEGALQSKIITYLTLGVTMGLAEQSSALLRLVLFVYQGKMYDMKRIVVVPVC